MVANLDEKLQRMGVKREDVLTQPLPVMKNDDGVAVIIDAITVTNQGASPDNRTAAGGKYGRSRFVGKIHAVMNAIR
jgi:hypothetical protein